MDENESPEKNMSFNLTVMNVIQLSFPLASLCDTEFNPEGLGMMEFTERGFEITVRNTKTHAIAKLFLSPELTDYHCNNPILTIINLNRIYRTLIDVIHYYSLNPSPTDPILIVFHNYGATKIAFRWGSPVICKKIRFQLSDDELFERFPDIVEFACEAHLKSSILRSTIYNVNLQELDTVSVYISNKLVTVHIGIKTYPVYRARPNDQGPRVRILREEKEHDARFQMVHLEALKKAANVGLEFCFGFLTRPEKNIMIRFDMQQLGYFVFVQEASQMVHKPGKPPYIPYKPPHSPHKAPESKRPRN